MSVKASISLTDSQDAFARDLVARGRYSSLSAVLQDGLELLRGRHESERAASEALRLLVEERRAGRFVDAAEGERRTAAMIARKRAERGLAG